MGFDKGDTVKIKSRNISGFITADYVSLIIKDTDLLCYIHDVVYREKNRYGEIKIVYAYQLFHTDLRMTRVVLFEKKNYLYEQKQK